MKKQTLIALGLMLLMPVILIVGGFLSSLVNPEIAAGHPNYVRNYHLLNSLKIALVLGAAAVVAILWFIVCYLVIRSKGRSAWWLFLAALGPFGFAILSVLNDISPGDTDRYARFVRSLNWFVRVAYEVCSFVTIWILAYGAMLLKRAAIIMIQSITAGMSVAQVIDIQNASSGMWAFSEGNTVMYMVALLYLIWPMAFDLVARITPTKALSAAR